MRILYISSSNCLGGGSVALYNIVKGMMLLGHQVFVVTTKEDDYLLHKLKEIGCPYVKLNLSLDIYPLNKNIFLYVPRLLYIIWKHHKGVNNIVKIIGEFQPDIVHTNVGPYSIGYDACQITGTKHVWHQREYQDKDFDMHFFPCIKTFIRKSHSENNYNICITKEIFEYRKFRPNHDVVIYDGVFSESQITQLPSREEKNYVLFVGRIEEAKGLYEVLSAYNLFRHKYPHIQLYVVGETPNHANNYKKKCEQFIRDNKFEDNVVFWGKRNNVFEYMAQARMLIVASRIEGFGFITTEAMLNSCPVIGKDTGGTKEQFDNGKKLMNAEIALRYHSQHELVEAMYYVMEHDMADMCQRAKDTVVNLYTTEKNIKNIEQYYKKILENKTM